MTSILPTFKPAKLYQGDRYWYVFYSFLNPATGKYVRFKEYFDINRIKDISVKRTYGKEMCSFLNQKLKEGFNPIEQTTIKDQGGTTLGILQSLFEEIVKGASCPTFNTYNTMINRLKRFLINKQLDNIRISDIDGNMADSFRDWMIDEEKLSKKSVNSTLSHLSGVWKKALKRGIAYQDPFTLVDRVKRDINLMSRMKKKTCMSHLRLKNCKGLQSYWQREEKIFAIPRGDTLCMGKAGGNMPVKSESDRSGSRIHSL